jgi:hypothetical protein
MFKITIEEIKTTKVMQDGPWVVVDRVPWTNADINEKTSRLYGESEEGLIAKEPLHEIRGYAPQREVAEKTTTKIYEQTVEGINLPEVIIAINQLRNQAYP